MRVVPSWRYWAPAAVLFSVYTPQPFTEPPAPAEAETLAPHLVRIPFRALAPNPYLHNTAQDESVVEPLDVPSGVFGRRLPSLGRNPYLHHGAQDESVAEADTYVPRLVTHQFKDPARRPQLGWHGAVEGVEQLDDVGGSLQVVADWDGFRLARAGRFAYSPPAADVHEAAVEPETWAIFHVRVPFRPLGRNPYLHHVASDESVVIPFELPGGVFGRLFPELGRNRYLWNTAQDQSVVTPLDQPHVLRQVPFKPFGRNPYLRHLAQDLSAPTLDAAPPALFAVQRPLRGLGRNPYLFHRDDRSAPEAETFEPFHVRLPLRALGRNPYLQHWDYASGPEAETLAPFLVRLPFRPFDRNLYLHHRDYDSVPPELADALVGFISPHRIEGFLAREEPFGFESPHRIEGFISPERPA